MREDLLGLVNGVVVENYVTFTRNGNVAAASLGGPLYFCGARSSLASQLVALCQPRLLPRP